MATPVWKQLLRLDKTAPTAFATLVLWLGAEFAVAVVAPLFVPDHLYLSVYLGPKSRAATNRFASGSDPYLRYDVIVGWRNQANSEHERWRTDQYGSRTAHAFDTKPQKPVRVLFVGDSRTSGTIDTDRKDTIASHAESDQSEALNFGIMAYSLDQMYLLYKHDLHRFQPDVVVVAIGQYVHEGIGNRYIPLRKPDESNMPYFKPRFHLVDGALTLVSVPEQSVYKTLLTGEAPIGELFRADTYDYRWRGAKRFGQTPLAAGVRNLLGRVRTMTGRVTGGLVGPGNELRRALMRAFVAEGKLHSARVVFLVLPSQDAVAPRSWRKLFPDHFGALIDSIRTDGFDLVDGRAAVRASGVSVFKIYEPDGSHFTAAGNAVLGQAVKEHLETKP